MIGHRRFTAFCLKSWIMRWITAGSIRNCSYPSKDGLFRPCCSNLFIEPVLPSAVHNMMSFSSTLAQNVLIIHDVDRVFPCAEFCNGHIEGSSTVVAVV